MTTIMLHDAPAWRTVARQQLRAVRGSMRRPAVFLLAALVTVFLLGVVIATRDAVLGQRPFGFSLDVAMTAPGGFFGLFAAGAMWQRQEPSRRAYFLAMPVTRTSHTWLRVGAGWVWLMAGIAGYLAMLVLLGWAVATIGRGELVSHLSAWGWVVMFAAATTIYLLISIAMIASEQPLLWMIGVPLGLMAVLDLPPILHWVTGTRAVMRYFNSPFGPHTAFWPVVQAASGPGFVAPWWGLDWRQGLAGTLFWCGVGIAGVWLAARHRPKGVR